MGGGVGVVLLDDVEPYMPAAAAAPGVGVPVGLPLQQTKQRHESGKGGRRYPAARGSSAVE